MIELENFLDFPDRLIEFASSCEWVDEVNPADGVVYPRIQKNIPKEILSDVFWNVAHKVGHIPKNPVTFLRQSPKGLPVPHKYHTDNSMGGYSMMIYLQDNPSAGTGFARHESGTYTAPLDEELLRTTIDDCNDDSKWQLYKTAEMVQNKAVIFNSELFHVALPIGGFGNGTNARTVFTCFFS